MLPAATSLSGLDVSHLLPPRWSKNQLFRPRLSIEQPLLQEPAVIVLQAPMGYGKTALLSQWRREAQARGRSVLWLNVRDGVPDGDLLGCLLQLLRQGGYPAVTPKSGGMPGPEQDGAHWLGEVARYSLDTLLVIDGLECLLPRSLDLLRYLVHHPIPNLQLVLGMRPGIDLQLGAAVDYGSALVMGPEQLRYQLAEARELMRLRLGERVDPRQVVQWFELSEGWPLGLQILLRGNERDAEGMRAERGQRVRDGVLAGLSEADLAFLLRLALLERVHPDLCCAVMGSAQASQHLCRLQHGTPIFVGERQGWLRMHNLVREALQPALEALPQQDKNEVHRRATAWLFRQQMLPEAAWHAHAAGEHRLAYDMAEQCLHLAVKQGAQEHVLRWLELVPEAELKKRPRLRLATAWALALSQRQGEVAALVRELPTHWDPGAAEGFDRDLIANDAAYYGDDFERCQGLLGRWEHRLPASADPRRQQMLINRLATLDIALGEPSRARYRFHALSDGARDPGYQYGLHWQHYIEGLSHLREGFLPSAEAVLRPALMDLECEMGRRHHLACMMAALLATVLYEQGLGDEAEAVLANRLAVLEQVGTPDSVCYAYRTAARLAMLRGEEHKAWEWLTAWYACGVARGLPRLSIASLAEQLRLYAHGAASQCAHTRLQQLSALIDSSGKAPDLPWRQQVDLLRHIGSLSLLLNHGAANLRVNTPEVQHHLQQAQVLAESLQAGAELIMVMALRAYCMEQTIAGSGEAGLREAWHLACCRGQHRLLADLHPQISAWADRVMGRSAVTGAEVAAEASAGGPKGLRREAPLSRAVATIHPGALLTPKEQSVLALLARSYSNKEIALALAVSDETVKWHLKNLFGKLGAGSRKHAVRRAALLGVLEFPA